MAQQITIESLDAKIDNRFNAMSVEIEGLKKQIAELQSLLTVLSTKTAKGGSKSAATKTFKAFVCELFVADYKRFVENGAFNKALTTSKSYSDNGCDKVTVGTPEWIELVTKFVDKVFTNPAVKAFKDELEAEYTAKYPKPVKTKTAKPAKADEPAAAAEAPAADEPEEEVKPTKKAKAVTKPAAAASKSKAVAKPKASAKKAPKQEEDEEEVDD